MKSVTYNNRELDAEVDCMFPDRWSPRSFDPHPLDDGQIQSLFEAARWAPSCFNEQPWLFLYAGTRDGRERLVSLLSERNRLWAPRAPLLAVLAARRKFGASGRENGHAAFDAGAAWMSLALQARRLGLYAHAMAGFDRDRAHDALTLSREDFLVMVIIAVGRRKSPADLPGDLMKTERPSERKPLAEVAVELSLWLGDS